VIYPVISLERRRLSVAKYIEILAESARVVLKGMGVPAKWDPKRPGLYVDDKKIASMGLRVSRGVVSHGMSVNCLPDSGGFGMIYPCKAPGLLVTSIMEITGFSPEKWMVAKGVAEELIRRIGG